MIYLDTSVLLAQLLAEDRLPPVNLWSEDLVSSRLLEYEVLNRIHARGLLRSHGDAARSILDGVAMVQMDFSRPRPRPRTVSGCRPDAGRPASGDHGIPAQPISPRGTGKL